MTDDENTARCEDAITASHQLRFACHFLRFDALKTRGKLESYETLRQLTLAEATVTAGSDPDGAKGRESVMVVLDRYADLAQFVATYPTIFISHQACMRITQAFDNTLTCAHIIFLSMSCSLSGSGLVIKHRILMAHTSKPPFTLVSC